MTIRVSDLLAAQRPHRVDAARNFDAILAAARSLSAEQGTDVLLADVARRAGVGAATLYRHFPTRTISPRRVTSPRSIPSADTAKSSSRRTSRGKP
jgi:hypothetical protein